MYLTINEELIYESFEYLHSRVEPIMLETITAYLGLNYEEVIQQFSLQ